jgi:hypothetical protein
MVFDKDALRSIRDEMTAALRPIELAHGISLKMGSMTFDAERFTCRIEALVAGSQDDVARKEWGRYCIFYGLKAEDFGKTVRVNGMSGTIYGSTRFSSRLPTARPTRFRRKMLRCGCRRRRESPRRGSLLPGWDGRTGASFSVARGLLSCR